MTHSTPSSALAVAAPHHLAVEEAKRVLASGGGNAVDAALVAACVLAVVYPHMCSAGGDVIALVREPDGRKVVVNASGAYGSRFDVDKLFPPGTDIPAVGPLGVSVPGAVSGWAALAERWGRRSIADILDPAIRLAAQGMAVSPGLAAAVAHERAILLQDPGMAATFFLDNRPVVEGDVVRQPALARTLQSIASAGPDSYYRGELAQRLARGMASIGTPVTGADLAAHHVSLEEPIARVFEDLTVSVAGPNSQGYTLLRNLAALGFDGRVPKNFDADLMAELFYASDRLRDTELADPRFAHVDVEGALSDRGVQAARADAEAAVRTGIRADVRTTPHPGGDTVAITAVDGDGLAVSIIQSVFHSFGAKVLEPLTGLVLHNRASFFSTDPMSPNRIAVGKRPAHTLMPVVVEHPSWIAAHGTMGGKAQSQIHTQLMLQIRGGASPQEAVAAPRFTVGDLENGRTDDLLVEPGLPRAVRSRIDATNFHVIVGSNNDSEVGHAMIARLGSDGIMSAGADPRSDGAVWVRN